MTSCVSAGHPLKVVQLLWTPSLALDGHWPRLKSMRWNRIFKPRVFLHQMCKVPKGQKKASECNAHSHAYCGTNQWVRSRVSLIFYNHAAKDLLKSFKYLWGALRCIKIQVSHAQELVVATRHTPAHSESQNVSELGLERVMLLSHQCLPGWGRGFLASYSDHNWYLYLMVLSNQANLKRAQKISSWHFSAWSLVWYDSTLPRLQAFPQK